ncbi:MAG: family 43 glycosylhydrolase, partial [Eubacterium sp.]|nr:family 43 glycosylhydrolase [Eubacterium sp.]
TQKTYLYRSNQIDGPWEKSYVEGFYHDASLLFDVQEKDGKREVKKYIVYGNTDIYLAELNDEMTGLSDKAARIIVSDAGTPSLGYEGSHLYKINGKYYLFLIHSKRDRWRRVEACYVADSLDGEFTNIDLTDGDLFDDDLGFRNSGIAQGGIVEGPEGVWHAIMFQDSGAIGRLPVLVPVTWRGDVPVFGTDGTASESIETTSFRPDYQYQPLVDSDDFRYDMHSMYESDKERYGCFGLRSIWQFNHEPDLSLVNVDSDKGCLWITTDKLANSIYYAKNTLTQRMTFPKCSATVTLDTSGMKDGDSAGLAAFQGNYAWVGVQREDGKLYAVMCSFTNTSGDVWNLSDDKGTILEKIELEKEALDSSKVILRLNASFDDTKVTENTPAKDDYIDEVFCEVDTGAGFRHIGSPHRLSFRLDHFTGCRFGLFIYSEKETGGSAGFIDFKLS